ncbi:MAG TPA: hypothetical protein VFM02_01295 [Candidatus Paceibacterota bacterium]|nr:hypothetical protein [Candidatus Paceibacterota bacterium]
MSIFPCSFKKPFLPFFFLTTVFLTGFFPVPSYAGDYFRLGLNHDQQALILLELGFGRINHICLTCHLEFDNDHLTYSITMPRTGEKTFLVPKRHS